MAKRLLVTSTDLMMIQFLAPHIENLAENGYEVEIACSCVGGRMEEVRSRLTGCTKAIYEVNLKRSPFSFANFKGLRELKTIIAHGSFDIIWTNEPVMGVMTRLAARKARRNGTKVLYMVHGFHFFKGAPWRNWLLFYPIERIMAHMCDMIITVNREDYERAKRFDVANIKYIHGIGINTERLTQGSEGHNIRRELHLDPDSFIVLSIGELNRNKNQKTIILALALLHAPDIHYVLCGKGEEEHHLKELAKVAGLSGNVHFLGYRTDVVDICKRSDVYVMPSYREGLPISSLEAMYCGLPLLTSKIRGLVDIMEEGVSGYMYAPDDAEGFAEGIRKLKSSYSLRTKMGERNKLAVLPYCLEKTKDEVLTIIKAIK